MVHTLSEAASEADEEAQEAWEKLLHSERVMIRRRERHRRRCAAEAAALDTADAQGTTGGARGTVRGAATSTTARSAAGADGAESAFDWRTPNGAAGAEAAYPEARADGANEAGRAEGAAWPGLARLGGVWRTARLGASAAMDAAVEELVAAALAVVWPMAAKEARSGARGWLTADGSKLNDAADVVQPGG